MKLAVLGATGGTGSHLVEHALAQGHQVIAIVRSPAKVTTTHDNLQVVEGDIFSDDSLAPHFAEVDAVLSCLGVSHFRKTTVYSDSITSIISAMRKANVSRLICLTSWCAPAYDRNDPGPWFLEWIFKPLFIGRALADMDVMEKYLMSSDCNDINFTIVRPPHLISTPSTGGEYLVEERHFVGGGTRRMPREDVAIFMLSLLETDKYDRKTIAIDCVK